MSDLGPVFPCHGIAGGRCTCGDPACRSPGKHPACPRGHLDAQPTEAWGPWPGNWGIALRPGIVVLDVDPRNGGSVAGLAAMGPLPDTWTQVTGGGGLHVAYACDLRLPAKLAQGIDIKQSGGYIMAPGSSHASGGTYRLIADLPPAPAPDWLLALGRDPAAAKIEVDVSVEPALPAEWHGRIAATVAPYYLLGQRHTLAKALGGWLAQRGCTPADAREVLARLPSIDPGARLRAALWAWKSGTAFGWHDLRAIMGDAAAALESAPAPRFAAEQAVLAETLARLGGSVTAAEDQASALPGWEAMLAVSRSKDGPPTIVPAAPNLALIFANHPDIGGALVFDQFAQRASWAKPTWGFIGELNVDKHWGEAWRWLRYRYRQAGLWNVPKVTIQDAMILAAEMRSFHPVRTYLDGLVWDGVPRLDDWLIRYAGADGDPRYLGPYGRTWLESGVARIYEPGCKVDVMLVSEGVQGIGKSTTLRTLAVRDEWFTDELRRHLEDKDTAMQLDGKWIIEHAELDAIHRSSVAAINAFLTRQADRYRAPYGRATVDHPRQCVFAGSTNNGQYLRDATGARRFSPVRIVRRPDLNALRADRDQLWAEAVHRYRAGEPWWVTDWATLQLATAEQEDRFEADPWEDVVRRWLDAPAKVLVVGQAPAEQGRRDSADLGELWEALGVPVERRDQSGTDRLGRIMRRLGWERRRVRTGAALSYRYFRQPVVPPCSPPEALNVPPGGNIVKR